MDRHANVAEVQHSNGEPYNFRLLTPIDPATIPGERMKWLWEHLSLDPHNFDDFGRDRADYFVSSLVAENSAHFEVGDAGYMCLHHIIPGLSAEPHLAMWDRKFPFSDVMAAIREMLDWGFKTHGLRRYTALIPVYNPLVKRVATLVGFKYEGEIRQGILFEKRAYNLLIYGLLREEFNRRH